MLSTYTNEKPSANCSSCGAEGMPWSLKGDIVTMRCPKCWAQWQTNSARCPHCFKPNGTAKPGFCKHCEAQQRGA